MAATLRGGLSLGLSGFTFWSHDIGGFVQKPTEELYRRWAAFGLLSSHSRCHGAPPREPWEYSAQFLEDFRRMDELRYRLMPYIYAQAKDSSERGLPMLRALFIEYPDDPGAWQVDDEYMFGSDILVAPLMETGTAGREVYLPKGQWIDYQSGKVYQGGWQKIDALLIPAVMLAREGSIIPHMKPALSTSQLDWKSLEMVVYASSAQAAQGLACLPSDNILRKVEAAKKRNVFALSADPFAGKAAATIRLYSGK
jgi:alpha-D-xyloside xylohydrolase